VTLWVEMRGWADSPPARTRDGAGVFLPGASTRSGLLSGATTRSRRRLPGPVRAAVGLPRASTRSSWITKGKYAQESRYPGLVRAGAAAVRGQYAQQFLYPGPVRAFGADLLAPDESGQPLVVSPPRVQAPGKSARGRARQNARERLPALDKEKPRNREDSGVFTRAMRGIS